MHVSPIPGMSRGTWALLLLLALIWGGSFFFAELALANLPPMTLTLHRVFWALPLLYAVMRLQGHAMPRRLRLWGAYLVMGALNNAIPFSLIFWGQTLIESGLASILNGTTAIFGAVVAGIFLRDEPLTRTKLAGAVIGLIGVAVIMGPSALHGLDPANLGQLAVLCATLSYAFASVWGKVTLADQPPVTNAFGMLAGSTLIMIPVALWSDGLPTLALPGLTWVAILGLSVLSTALAYLLYFALLKRAGSANLMLVTLLIPPFAVTLGAVAFGERLGVNAAIGFGLIALGLAITDGRLVQRKRR